MADTTITDGVTLSAAAWGNDVNSATYNVLSAVAGTNTITATGPSTYTAYATKPVFVLIPANTSTGATTINITPSGGAALGAKNMFCGGAACVGGEIRAGVPCVIVYDGTQFNIIGPYVGGNLPTGQIKFPAAQNASSNANTLDDYEEGTFTPVLRFGTVGDLSVTYATQVGFYTKIGELCTSSFLISTSAFTHTTASGGCEVAGLPFTSSTATDYVSEGALRFGGITKATYTNFVSEINANVTFMRFVAGGSGVANSVVVVADMPTGGSVILASTSSYKTS